MTMIREEMDISAHDLRALLFWASIGVRDHVGGSYQQSIERIIRHHAKALSYPLTFQPIFKKKPRKIVPSAKRERKTKK